MSRAIHRLTTRVLVLFGGAALACALSAATAAAQESFDGYWPSSTFGALRLRIEGDEVRGRYDLNGGRLRGHAEGRNMGGIWVQDSAQRRCDEERMGSHYWGRFQFHVNRDGDDLRGLWGYCNESPDRDWTAHR